MKLFCSAVALSCLVAFGHGVAAQEAGAKTTTTTKTKVTIKDGKTIKATGCIARADTGGLVLTQAADKNGPLPDYLLVLDDDKERSFGEHVGYQVELTGKAANKGDGKVKFEVEEKTKPKHGDEQKTERSSEMSGDIKIPLLGVKSFKMLDAACR